MTILIVGEESLINLEIDKILKLEKNYSQIKYDSLTPCDKIIEELREDGSLAELSNKYFGYDATKNPLN